ncbi:nac domain-containing protein 91 [Quercus suber]|uniref:Nac domain-containing protein 91 n=1 Tax=Quercus suber TaxID=58331 RepID=A0AAW0LYV6_QUESU
MDDPDLYSLPGYRFSPTDDELIEDYLKLKITGKDNKNTWRIPEIDIYKYEPWDLPSFARIPTKDKVWYFITPQSLKHKNGNGMNRSTEKGYWKSTGKDRKIKSGGEVIAMKKSLGYHIGRSPNGERTEWKMYEYRTTQKEFDGKHPAPNISESWDLTPYNPDDCFCYKYSSQNNLAFDDETQENMVSVKDNGSCRSSDAIAEFELKYQDLLWLEEIINPKVSPGLLKSGSYLGSEGGSSDQIIGSD